MKEKKRIYLRPIERNDALQVLLWENDPENWQVTGTEEPYTLDFIYAYIDSLEDVTEACQLRMMICKYDNNECIGMVDLNQIDFINLRADVGILIALPEERKKGFAKESLFALIEIALLELKLHNLGASIMSDNLSSIRLFESVGFQLKGERKDWYKVKNGWKDEKIYQICLKETKRKAE